MRERLMVSFFLAVILHVVAFLILQQLIRFERFRLPERIGPIVVELADVPVPAEVREHPPEPRREPPPQASTRETTAAPQAAPAVPQPARPAPAASATARPRVAPGVPTPKPQPEQQPIPRSSSQTERRELPSEPAGTEPARAVRTPQPQPQQPAYNQPVTVPKEAEVRPEAGVVDQPSVLDLSRVDTALSGTATGAAAPAAGGTPSGSAAGGSTAAGSPAATPRDYSIEWVRPEQGRQAISTPAPEVPAWVSRQGTRLQVTVSFVLTAEGLLREVTVERSSGYSDVDSAVLEALRRWRFRAAPGGKDVSGRVRYSIVPR
jgi:TonB family protein